MHAETEERESSSSSGHTYRHLVYLCFTHLHQSFTGGPQPNLNYSPCNPWHNTFPILIQLILLKEHNVYEKTV